jgi:hypothetical protein
MNSMMLVSGTFQNIPTFRMIPLTKECPYVEAYYNPMYNVLGIVSLNKKAALHLTNKLDDNGDPILRKDFKAREEQKQSPYKQHKVTLENYEEFFITNRDEIKWFIEKFAANMNEFDYSKYLTSIAAEEVPAP